jgi:DNA polymerase-1
MRRNDQLELFNVFSQVLIDKRNKFDFSWNLVKSESGLEKLVSRIEKSECSIIGIDTETTGLNPKVDCIWGISIAINGNTGFYIPTRNAEERKRICLLNKVFLSNEITKCGSNLAFDLGFFKAAEIHINGPYFDTMIAAKLLNEERYGLKFLVKKNLGIEMIEYEEMLGNRNIEEISLEDIAPYCVGDSIYCRRLTQYYIQRLKNEFI